MEPIPPHRSLSTPKDADILRRGRLALAADAEVAPAMDEPVSDFAAARIPCPVCGTRLEATREHCFGCGWKVESSDVASQADTLRRSARTIYLLMALSLFLALPAVGALVLACIDRGKARGSWLDSHFEWQVETLWIVFWAGVTVLMATWLGDRFLGLGELGLLAGIPALIWYANRIAKGWTRLADGEPIPAW